VLFRRSIDAKSTSSVTDDLLRVCDDTDGRSTLSIADNTLTSRDVAKCDCGRPRSFLAPLREAAMLFNMRGLNFACPLPDIRRALDKFKPCLLVEPLCNVLEPHFCFFAGAGSHSCLQQHKQNILSVFANYFTFFLQNTNKLISLSIIMVQFCFAAWQLCVGRQPRALQTFQYINFYLHFFSRRSKY